MNQVNYSASTVVDRLKVYRIRSFRRFFGWTVLLVKAFGASLQNHMVGYC